MNAFHPPLCIAAALFLVGCTGVTSSSPMTLTVEDFGETRSGERTRLFELRNRFGVVAKITDFGAALVELHAPDRSGALSDIVLGFADVAGYESSRNQYFGCTTGRVANRIGRGRFTLAGREYRLATNDGNNQRRVANRRRGIRSPRRGARRRAGGLAPAHGRRCGARRDPNGRRSTGSARSDGRARALLAR